MYNIYSTYLNIPIVYNNTIVLILFDICVVLIVLQIQPEAAYLYDAVHIYAHAVVNILNGGGNPYNGTAILNAIKGCRYKSAMG